MAWNKNSLPPPLKEQFSIKVDILNLMTSACSKV